MFGDGFAQHEAPQRGHPKHKMASPHPALMFLLPLVVGFATPASVVFAQALTSACIMAASTRLRNWKGLPLSIRELAQWLYSWATPAGSWAYATASGVAWLFVIWQSVQSTSSSENTASNQVPVAELPSRIVRRPASDGSAWLKEVLRIADNPRAYPASGPTFERELDAYYYEYAGGLPAPVEKAALLFRTRDTAAWELDLWASKPFVVNDFASEFSERVSAAGNDGLAWFELQSGPGAGTFVGIHEDSARVVTLKFVDSDRWVGIRGLSAWACREGRVRGAACQVPNAR